MMIADESLTGVPPQCTMQCGTLVLNQVLALGISSSVRIARSRRTRPSPPNWQTSI